MTEENSAQPDAWLWTYLMDTADGRRKYSQPSLHDPETDTPLFKEFVENTHNGKLVKIKSVEPLFTAQLKEPVTIPHKNLVNLRKIVSGQVGRAIDDYAANVEREYRAVDEDWTGPEADQIRSRLGLVKTVIGDLRRRLEAELG